MADEAEPGAPTIKAVEEAADRVRAKAVAASSAASHDALSTVRQIDQTVLRLNKLLASPGGLSAFLSALNYKLYILAYLQTKSSSLASLSRQLVALLSNNPAKAPAAAIIAPGAVPPVAALAGLISRARTTLRLFGLFPLYAWLRTLLAGPKAGTDAVLHRIALTQCLSYITYQALENISVLADNGVIPTSFIARINRGNPTTARIYLWAYRAWLGGVSCDFVRLAREAQLESRRRSIRRKMQDEGKAVAEYQDEEDRRVDSKWWVDFMIASAWLPMAAHFSSETGVPGWNLGWMGVCGLVAGGSRAKGLWDATLTS
ncbi:hypothetical protein P154DRAFT_619305 [Amniculicola lignicola CBS 123094]|uniref:Peroxin 11C n=1 Tax=Amniculicola lignicola CBS 123094 TaxID=1392246 RepID=A0A6A5WIG1_9PLEO|nr:hypothetical protein P154DRAFT_619305 [Amniculicola lignicola CBS 123094]